MVAAQSSSDLFSRVANPARGKFVVLGKAFSPQDETLDRLRSLHIEHVSSATLMRQEICRRTLAGRKAQEAELAAFRRWYMTRKPDAGFLLEGFPATMLQALVLDEWLDTRNELIDAVIAAADAPRDIVDYYRNTGLLWEPQDFSAR